MKKLIRISTIVAILVSLLGSIPSQYALASKSIDHMPEQTQSGKSNCSPKKILIETALLVRDINPGPSGSGSMGYYFGNIGNILYFTAGDGVNGIELWRSEGTEETTTMLANLNPTDSFQPRYLTNINEHLFFSANDGLHGQELWKSDGTVEGTSLIKDINPNNNSSSPNHLTNVNGTLFFAAYHPAYGIELWKSDGTPEGTVLVKDIATGTASSNPENLTESNGILYFSASDGTYGIELWKSDGTSDGTIMVKDITQGVAGSNPNNLADVNGTLYFAAAGNPLGYDDHELWKSDGTSNGTILVKDIYPGVNSSALNYLKNVNGTLYFIATDGVHGFELWKSNGTFAGTVMVKDINTGTGNGAGYRNFAHIGNIVFFGADDGTNGSELWESDGTSDGTILVQDIAPGIASSVPQNFASSGNVVYFAANDGFHGWELWRSDGTTTGTVLVKDINPAGNAWPDLLFDLNGTLFFRANDGIHGSELWKVALIDSSANLIVTNINNNGVGSLRQAIATASNGDTITFHPSLSGQTITLESTLVVNKSLTIDGSALASKVSISGNDTVTVFYIGSGANVNLTSLIITNGKASEIYDGNVLLDGSSGGILNFGNLNIRNCTITNNNNFPLSWGNGGGINNKGELIISDSTISNNSAGIGGGIMSMSEDLVQITNSIFSGNTAMSDAGGGIFNFSPLEISNSTFVGNSSVWMGGGIFQQTTSPLTIKYSTFSGNSSGSNGGGAVASSADPLTIVNSTFYDNSSDGSGGAIFSYGPSTIIKNSTISGNSAVDSGGGIYNMSDSFGLINTIVANSTADHDCYNENGNAITASINNLIETNGLNGHMCGIPTSSLDPKLGPLADNGGFTQTMALLPGSPAIDAGDDTSCPATDQRGVSRPQGAGCDIGAYEYDGPMPTFKDVPFNHSAWQYIEAIYNAGITGGCTTSPLNYCPNQSVTRAQMAVFLLRGIHGSSYTPSPATGTVFADVPSNAFAASWIEQMVAEGITAGCGGGNFCPNQSVTRAQMAVFLLRAKHGSSYTPPAASGTVFTDVPLGSFAAAWIEQLVAEGITSGCGGGNYCPNQSVTRAQMAVFLQRTFNLPLP